ncbi:MAG: radical SAM family heme chaperone HemW [Mycobacteriaceae bacterium]|uniref:radical SAM family heme chaperone HemW n=1 Tax=Corynebacterium sp. TaxID=1720 RepID=UPI003F99CD68
MTTSADSTFDRYGLYIHVPFCSTRCGYCDFNTYTPGESGSSSTGTYLDALEAELEIAASDWDRTGPPSTVFLGGGTPSLLGAEGLSRILRAVKRTVGLAPGAEVTTESNPESTSPEYFDALLDVGYTRISLGMQSAAGHVLKVLDRTHTPGRATEAAQEALAAGFEHVNLDLIYGTPTETDDDLRLTLDSALSTGVDHISAYSLIVEDGTAMARKVRKGLLPQPDEDVYADRYEMIDSALRDAGMGWYEVSNWARPGGECRHNLVYWRSGQWWGAGPGAHGCVRLVPDATSADGEHDGLTRLVNAKLPRRYSEALSDGRSPVTTVERLDGGDVHTERIMLGLRLREGLPDDLLADGWSAVEHHVGLGLLEHADGRTRLTDRGRLLADGIVTDILLAEDEVAAPAGN